MKITLEFDLNTERKAYDMAMNAPGAFERISDAGGECLAMLDKFPPESDVARALHIVLDTLSPEVDS